MFAKLFTFCTCVNIKQVLLNYNLEYLLITGKETTVLDDDGHILL